MYIYIYICTHYNKMCPAVRGPARPVIIVTMINNNDNNIIIIIIVEQ